MAGRLIVLTGPSGVGKGTLVKLLRQNHPELYLSISATTRIPRPTEVDGVHYYFLTKEKFQELIAEDQLLEWAEYLGNFYGTPRPPVMAQLALGQDVLLEIEVQGAAQVMANFPDPVTIFLLPPSLEALESRLQLRRSESPEAITLRLKRAYQELQQVVHFQHQVVNDDLEACLKQLESVLYPTQQPKP